MHGQTHAQKNTFVFFFRCTVRLPKASYLSPGEIRASVWKATGHVNPANAVTGCASCYGPRHTFNYHRQDLHLLALLCILIGRSISGTNEMEQCHGVRKRCFGMIKGCSYTGRGTGVPHWPRYTVFQQGGESDRFPFLHSSRVLLSQDPLTRLTTCR